MVDAERMDRTARGFRRFAELECRDSSPLYERLSLGIAQDRGLLELATHTRPGQPVHLFFSCVHWLLLAGTLARFASEVAKAWSSEAWLGWGILLSGLAQALGLVLFFWNMRSRIRPVGSQAREAKGERF